MRIKATYKTLAEWLALLLLNGVLLYNGWYFGGTSGDAAVVSFGLCCVSLLALSVALRGTSSAGLFVSHKSNRFLVAGMVGLVCYLLVGVINPAYRTLPVFGGLEPVRHLEYLPSTVRSVNTFEALILLLCCASVYRLGRALRSRGVLLTAGLLVISATVMAAVALAQGTVHRRGDPVGMFLNENNFSAYINLIMPVAFAFARETCRGKNGWYNNPGVLLYFATAIMATGVLLSGSRAGAVIGLLIIGAWLVLEAEGTIRQRHSLLYILVPLIAVVGLVGLLGLDVWHVELHKPGQAIGLGFANRFTVAKSTWRMFLDHPVFGIGAGGFREAFPYYQPENLGGFYRHAHNDWVQWLAELGIVGAVLGALTVGVALFGNRSVAVCSRVAPGLRQGMWLGLAGTALHAIIDFPFRIPAIMLVASLWVGILSRPRCKNKHP